MLRCAEDGEVALIVKKRKDDEAGLAPDGRIDPDSFVGKQFGFTSDLFDGWLWRMGKKIVISFIVSKHPGAGHFTRLIRAIEANGYVAEVPTPRGQMESILKSWGWKPYRIRDKRLGTVAIWNKTGSAK